MLGINFLEAKLGFVEGAGFYCEGVSENRPIGLMQAILEKPGAQWVPALGSPG